MYRGDWKEGQKVRMIEKMKGCIAKGQERKKNRKIEIMKEKEKWCLMYRLLLTIVSPPE